jgi:hypothetical protein
MWILAFSVDLLFIIIFDFFLSQLQTWIFGKDR